MIHMLGCDECVFAFLPDRRMSPKLRKGANVSLGKSLMSSFGGGGGAK